MLQVKRLLFVFGCYRQWFNVSGRQKTVSEIKCYLETVAERPTYLETLTFVHGITILVCAKFSEKYNNMIVIQK